MQTNSGFPRTDQIRKEIVRRPSPSSEQIRFGAPDGPRPRHCVKYDGESPLEYPGHEAVARFLASPLSIREFKSVQDLAKHFRVTRMTIYRWGHDPNVIKRAHFLSEINQMAGDLLARQEWPRIMQTAVRKAIEGDLQSIKFCESRAFPKEVKCEHSNLGATVSIQDLIGTIESDNELEQLDKSSCEEGEGR